MTDCGQVPCFADDSALPDEECPSAGSRASIDPDSRQPCTGRVVAGAAAPQFPEVPSTLHSRDQFGSDSITQGWQFRGPIEDLGSPVAASPPP
jgi:hypothetical protein